MLALTATSWEDTARIRLPDSPRTPAAGGDADRDMKKKKEEEEEQKKYDS